MADVTGASLQPIFDRLTQVERHHPMEAQTFADWTTEAGDIVTMQRDGDSFQGPIHQTQMTWRGAAETQINSQENEDREDIEKVSRRRYGRSGSGMYNNQRIFHEMFDYDGILYSSILMTESELRTHFDSLYDGLQSNLLLTRSEMSASFINTYEGLQSHLLMTASALSATFEGLYDGLQSSLLITRSEMSTSFNDIYHGLQSHLLMTASELTTTFIDLYNGVESHVTQTASSWGVSISGVVGPNGRVTAASIATAINTSTGQSEAKINADRVYIGSQNTETIIGGKLNTSDLYATIANLSIIKVKTLEGDSIKFWTSGSGNSAVYTSIRETVEGYKIVKSGDNYKLQCKRWNSTEWNDVSGSETFSRATTLSGAWSSGTYTVSASPQSQTKSTTLHSIVVDENLSPSGTTVRAYCKVYYATGNPQSPSADTGFTRQLISLSGATVYENGRKFEWDNIRSNYLTLPVDGTSDSMTIYIPAADYHGQSSAVYALDVDNDYAYIMNANRVKAQKANPAYENGWNGARGSSYLSVPTSDIGNHGAYGSGSASYAYVTVKYPKAYANRDSSGNPNPNTVEYTISGGSYTTSGGNTYSCVNLMAGQNVVARARVVCDQSSWNETDGTVNIKIKGLDWISFPITRPSVSYSITVDGAGSSPAESINTALGNYTGTYYSGDVPTTKTNNVYRYIKFTVGGNKRAIYFN